MSRVNQLGTHIRFEDGREATTVYNGLDGVGVKWGIHYPVMEDFPPFNPFADEEEPEGFKWYPDAMLRSPYSGAKLECIDMDYELID